MNKTTFTEEKKDSAEVIKFFINNFKVIAFTTLFSVALALIFTSFITKEYYSSATIFPTSTNSIEATIDNPQFGYDIEADRLIQLLQSNDVRDSVINEFDLINYYQLDTTKKTWMDDLRKLYAHDIRFERTPYMSIIVSAQTHNPEMSSNVVNRIISLANVVRSRIFKSNIYDAFKAIEKEYKYQATLVDSIVQKIYLLRNTIKNPALLLLQNKNINITLDKNVPEYPNSTYLEQEINRYTLENNKLNELGLKYQKATNIYNRPLPSIYIVERAVPLYKKVFPSYSKNILIALVFGVFISTSLIFLKQKISSLNL